MRRDSVGDADGAPMVRRWIFIFIFLFLLKDQLCMVF